MLIYVDDLIVIGNSVIVISRFKHKLSTCFHMKDLDLLKYFLGIKVAQNASRLYLSQRKYALDIISETSFSRSKPAVTPIEQNHQLATVSSPFLSTLDCYLRLVCRLIYLTITKPELAYVVHVLGSIYDYVSIGAWDATLRVVCYFKSSPGQVFSLVPLVI